MSELHIPLRSSEDRIGSHSPASAQDPHCPPPQLPYRAERPCADAYAARARPTFLYVMYAMILWSLPIGLIAAVSPETARRIADGMTRYLSALPEALYALFASGYLGYATLRQWGKVKGGDR